MTKSQSARELQPSVRAAPQDNFNALFPTAANTIGAPRPPATSALVTSVRYGSSKSSIDVLIKKLAYVRDRNGIVLAAVDILTHPDVIEALMSVNASVIVTKCKPSIPLARKYNQLKSEHVRIDFPGRVLPNLLLKRDGATSKEDFGILGGIRMLGNYYSTMRMQINEKRPRMHTKFWLAMIPDAGQSSGWKFVCGQDGTLNWSTNAEASFEQAGYTEDPVYLQYLYDWWTHYYSLSERMYHFSLGLTPEYVWMPKKQTFATPPACSQCGGVTSAPYSAQDKHQKYPVDTLRCVVCNTLNI